MSTYSPPPVGAQTPPILAAAGAGVMVYRQGETSPSGNVFATMAAALAACPVGGSILVDASLGQPVLAAGLAYALGARPLLGAGQYPVLIAQEGATITGAALILDGVSLSNAGSAPVYAPSFGQVLLRNAASLATDNGAGPVVHVGNSAFVGVSATDACYLGPGTAAPVLTCTGTGQAILDFGDDTIIAGGSLSGNGSITLYLTGGPTLQAQAGASNMQVSPLVVAVDPTGLGAGLILRKALASGGATGTADDVTIFPIIPFDMRIVDVYGMISSAGAGGSTMTLRSASGGGGSALWQALSTAATGVVRSTTQQSTQDIGSGGAVYLRRSDRSAVGTLIMMLQRR